MIPVVIKGGQHSDERGNLTFNNSFNATAVKRMYTIEHTNTSFIRGWIGHEMEHRWFTVMTGAFCIQIVQINDWTKPFENAPAKFVLNAGSMDILHIPPGHIFSIRATQEHSKLLVLANEMVGATTDERRFPFENT